MKITLNAGRSIVGQLRGYDMFMNLVMDECVEVKSEHEKVPIGMVVVRGNSVVDMEILDSIIVGGKTLGAGLFN